MECLVYRDKEGKTMLVEKKEVRIPGDYELHANIYIPDGNKQFPAVLLCHGFLSAMEEYGELPAHIAEKGYVVLTYDFRGHGKSEGDRGYFTAISHLNDSERALNTLLSHVKVSPENIAIVGHSLGSIAATRLATESENGRKCKTCILLAPPRKFIDSINKIEYHAYRLLSKFAWPYLLITGKHLYLPYQYSAKDIYISPKAIENAEKLGFLQKNMSVNNYFYMIKQIDHEKYASGLELPTLLIVAKNDKLVPNYASKRVFDAIKSSVKKYVEIENTGHSMMADASSDKLEQELFDWFDEVFLMKGKN